jgi:hypothetical protein
VLLQALIITEGSVAGAIPIVFYVSAMEVCVPSHLKANDMELLSRMTSQREKRVISHSGGKVPLLFMHNCQWFEFTCSLKTPAIVAEIGKCNCYLNQVSRCNRCARQSLSWVRLFYAIFRD